MNKNGQVWTQSTPYEDEVATQMLQYQGRFKGETGLAFLAWFFGADPRSDADNLLKLVIDAAVKAGVIDDDKIGVICYVSGEARRKDDEGNPFPDHPSTRIRIGTWI